VPSPFTIIERRSQLPVRADEAFDWHARPGALERLAPPWERLEVLERQGGIEDGGRTVLRVGVGPFRTRWVAVHRDYEPGRQFADEQTEGPFASWRHLHRFEPAGDGSVAIDRIEYSPPFGTLGAAAEFVARPRVERMLEYRHRVLAGDLAAHAAFRDRPRLHVAITGASGLLGTALTHFLTTGGHRVTPITRARGRSGAIHWDPARAEIDRAALEGVDAVVHLAGESVGRRWTAERKRRIHESRIEGTRLLADAMAATARPPRVLVSASGVGAYGDRGDEILTEASSTLDAPPDFFVQLAREWEAAAHRARAAGVRVVIARMGVVLTPAGGALQRMLPPFRCGVGGPLGSGRQWLSWVAMDDALGALHHALMSDRLSGPVNVTSPQPVRSRDFARTLGRVLGRPAILPVPAAALRLAFGEMADVALLSSQRVMPSRLGEAGYGFRFALLEPALRHVLGR
jgi:uncharacterized protein